MAPSQPHATLDQLTLILDTLTFVDLVQLDPNKPFIQFFIRPVFPPAAPLTLSGTNCIVTEISTTIL